MLWEYLLIDEPGFQRQKNLEMFDVSAWIICPILSPNIAWAISPKVLCLRSEHHQLYEMRFLLKGDEVTLDSLRIQPWLRRAQISCAEMWSKPRGASKLNRYPPLVMSIFLALNVQTSLMHIWNWFEIHSAARWCCIEGEVTKKNHQITASDEEPGGLQKTCIKIE